MNLQGVAIHTACSRCGLELPERVSSPWCSRCKRCAGLCSICRYAPWHPLLPSRTYLCAAYIFFYAWYASIIFSVLHIFCAYIARTWRHRAGPRSLWGCAGAHRYIILISLFYFPCFILLVLFSLFYLPCFIYLVLFTLFYFWLLKWCNIFLLFIDFFEFYFFHFSFLFFIFLGGLCEGCCTGVRCAAMEGTCPATSSGSQRTPPVLQAVGMIVVPPCSWSNDRSLKLF